MCAAGIFFLRWIDPWTTTVQIQRRVQALRAHRPYKKRYEFVPLSSISLNLQHAVVAAEDGRFRQHHGFDWIEMQKVVQEDLKRHRIGRGGSTITQQLVKNLFLTTERSFVRKGAEFALVPVMEALSDQGPDSGTVPERDRMGPRSLWRGGRGGALLPRARLRV